MTSVADCQHTHWQSMFDSEGFMYEEACVACGKRRIAQEVRWNDKVSNWVTNA